MKPTNIYLFLYNATQVLGWGLILVKTAKGLLIDRLANAQLYENVELELQIFQTAAILEIIHTALGLVRSPFATTLIQVFSRVFVVWPILFKIISSRNSIGVPMLLTAWSITEVVRYLFYALNIIKSVPHILVWMRYTFFYALYPIGASGEVITMISALPEIAKEKYYTFELPNALNCGFSFYYCVIVLCLMYLPGFPQLYGYMIVQRKKVLSGSTKKTA